MAKRGSKQVQTVFALIVCIHSVHNTVHSIEKWHVILSSPMNKSHLAAHISVVVSKVIHKFFKTSCRVELVTARLDVVAKALLEKDMSAVVPLI
jgi:hypothetical protein